MALKTIACILKYKSLPFTNDQTFNSHFRNERKGSLNRVVRKHVFELKIPRLIRSCLDDMNPSVITSTVDALHALVVDSEWEALTLQLIDGYR